MQAQAGALVSLLRYSTSFARFWSKDEVLVDNVNGSFDRVMVCPAWFDISFLSVHALHFKVTGAMYVYMDLITPKCAWSCSMDVPSHPS